MHRHDDDSTSSLGHAVDAASHEPRTQPRSALRTESISDLKHPPGASTYRLRLTERYRSVDPFQRKSRLVPEVPEHSPGLFGPRSAVDLAYSPAYSPYSLPLPVVRRRLIPRSTIINAAYLFLFDSTPRELYLSFLFRLPSLYFARVARVFEDAELSKPDIKKMVSATAQEWEGPRVPSGWNWNNESARLPPALLTFRRSWEEFIDSLMTEWKTLNLVSVLLLSAILTVLQIQGAGDDPVTRTAAFVSLLCALTSLSYGCIFIVRFGTMKKMHKASSWADEAQRTDTVMWWNVWVMLAMPAVWLAWSMAAFLVCILSFVWRTGSTDDPPTRSPLSPHAALVVRIAISSILAMSLAYSILIVKTLKRYGRSMDEAWMNRALEWTKEGIDGYRAPDSPRWSPVVPQDIWIPTTDHGSALVIPPPHLSAEPTVGRVEDPFPDAFQRPNAISREQNAAWLRERVSGLPPLETIKVAAVDGLADDLPQMPPALEEHDVRRDDWEQFTNDLALVWAGKSYGPSWARLTRSSSDELKTRYRIAASIIDTWNIRYFIRRGVEVFLYRGRECRSGQRFGPESGRLPVDDDGVLPGRGGPACEEYACYLTRRALCGDRPGPPRSLCGLYDLVDAAGLDLSWDDLLVHARDSRSSLGGPHTHRGTDGSPESDCVHEPGLSDSHLGHGSQKPVGQDSLPTPLLLHAATLKGLASALPNGPRSDGTPPEVPPGESPPAPAAFSRPNLIDAAQRAAWLSERVAGQSAFEMLKIGDMDALAGGPPPPMPAVLEQHGVHDEDWARLMHDVSAVWTSGPPTDPRSDAGALVDRWNSAYFFGRGVEVRLCEGGSGPVDGLLLLLGADGAADAFTLYVTRRAFLGSPDAGSVGGREGLHVAGRPTLSGEDSGVRSSAAVTAGDAPDIRTPTASLAARELDGRQGALQGYHIFTVPSPFFRPVALPGRFPPFPPTKVRARDAFPVAPVAADDDDDDDDDRDGREERSSAIWAILEGHDVDLEDWTRFMHDLSLVFAGTLTLNVDDCGGLVAGSGGVVGEFLRFWNDAYFLPREVAVSVVDGGGGGAGLGNRALCLSYAPLEDAGSDEGLIIAGL